MKERKWEKTLKEILAELSVIPIFCIFLALAIAIGSALPDGFFDIFPIEAIFVLAVVAILALLYAIAGVVTVVQKIKKRSESKDKDNHTEVSK